MVRNVSSASCDGSSSSETAETAVKEESLSSAIEFPAISNKGNQYGADIGTIFSGDLLR